jgi:hypothetical protein
LDRDRATAFAAAARAAAARTRRERRQRDSAARFTGIATLGEIADVLEYERGEVEQLWDRLPLADLEIAELLTLTRQQVISLRRSARERLERPRQRLTMPRRTK